MKYSILQLKDNAFQKYGFMPYDYAKDKGLRLEDYDDVYQTEIPLDESENIFQVLDVIFAIFNIKKPEDFKGRSMSISDMVKLEDGRLFYCDLVGWRQLSSDLL